MSTRTFTRDEVFLAGPVVACLILIAFSGIAFVGGVVTGSHWWFFACIVVTGLVTGGHVALTRWIIAHKETLTLVVQQEDETPSSDGL
jgi:hypothetical protein